MICRYGVLHGCKAQRILGNCSLPTFGAASWIPASEPPKEWKVVDEFEYMIDYFAWSPDEGYMFANWFEPAKIWLVDGERARITHWMPLPEPPKED